MANQTTQVNQPFADFLRSWWYEPVTKWVKTFEEFFHPEFYFGCNIIDKDDELKVLDEAGSYGKQLSKIFQAMDLLVAHVKEKDLTPEERLSLEDYKAFKEKIDGALAKSRGPKSSDLTLGYVQRLETALESRAKTAEKDPEFERVMELLSLVVHKLELERSGNR